MAGEVAPDYFDPLAVDEAAARDAARWRKAERARLLAEREVLTNAQRADMDAAVAVHLDRVLKDRFGGAEGMVVAAYWPIRAEVDLRDWMARQASHGIRVALPVVTAPDAPLVFRPWSPDAPMRAGRWNIPEPATDQVLAPQIVLAPLVGWDRARFRMGYGGGFYDRTLASMTPRPYAIGIGLAAAGLRTIYPQPHDVALDLIVTEKGTA
ncbi:5-formyltetrahydrofolate cyclo-ligase [Paracoccus aurantiacus]|uniref:5-formyltetrahydrofolate cyclo-ligase n=2 Tax=Paracoccus aurantiacus TaxID=2599412 RepID=A0A5C6S6R8_9RHOB|nr:5-formyltetrahydrofolate cyclo-ligase [Paracoccus aurantiacus]